MTEEQLVVEIESLHQLVVDSHIQYQRYLGALDAANRLRAEYFGKKKAEKENKKENKNVDVRKSVE